MADHQAPRTYRRASAGPVAVLCVVGAVLVGSAACSTGQPAAGTPSSGQPSAGLVNPPISGSASLRSVRTLRSVHDVAGQPIPFGTARYLGAVAHKNVGPGVIGIAVSSSGRGYLLATANGRVFRFGDARFHGSIVARIKDRVAAIVETNNGGGYWLVASNGRVFSFGDARFHGSVRGLALSTPIVAMSATPDGGGYWLVASNGRVFHYGDAHFYGSAAGEVLSHHIVSMAVPDGGGYWLVASNGRVFHYGDAHFYGSVRSLPLSTPIVAMAATPDGRGYWLVASNGRVFHYGDAHFYGSASPTVRKNPIIAMAATPDGRGYWLLPTIPAPPVGLPAPGKGFVAGHVTSIGDSVMLDAQPALESDIPGIDVEAAVSRQWDDGITIAQQLESENRLGAIVVIDLGTNGPVSQQQFTDMMEVLSGASRVVFVTVHLPSYYTWSSSVNATLEQGVPHYARDRLADFNKLADKNPQWFYSDGIHMPIGGAGAQAMASLIKSKI
ncbi:MAG: hypothetical protein WAV54_14075 [Acidimicrobiales bacterium]